MKVSRGMLLFLSCLYYLNIYIYIYKHKKHTISYKIICPVHLELPSSVSYLFKKLMLPIFVLTFCLNIEDKIYLVPCQCLFWIVYQLQILFPVNVNNIDVMERTYQSWCTLKIGGLNLFYPLVQWIILFVSSKTKTCKLSNPSHFAAINTPHSTTIFVLLLVPSPPTHQKWQLSHSTTIFVLLFVPSPPSHQKWERLPASTTMYALHSHFLLQLAQETHMKFMPYVFPNDTSVLVINFSWTKLQEVCCCFDNVFPYYQISLLKNEYIPIPPYGPNEIEWEKSISILSFEPFP